MEKLSRKMSSGFDVNLGGTCLTHWQGSKKLLFTALYARRFADPICLLSNEIQ
jgi:hypothetical protein